MNAPVSTSSIKAAAQSGKGKAERRVSARHVWFLNSAFDRIGFETALKRVAERDSERPFAFVVTPNVDHLVRLQRDSVLAPLYAQAWLTVCDSRVLELIAALSGEEIDVTAGSDLTEALFERAIAPDDRIAVIGGDEGVIDAIRSRYGLENLSWYNPPMGLRHKPDEIAENDYNLNIPRYVDTFEPEEEIDVAAVQREIEQIEAGLKSRTQALAERGYDAECTGIGLCVGASLDFLSGKARRAPVWMRRARLEWLHRLMEEPRRMWRRYLVDGPKILFIWWEWRKARAKLRAFEKSLQRNFLTPGS